MTTKQYTLDRKKYTNAECKYCGKKYLQTHKLQKYCSSQCREKAVREQKHKSYYNLRGQYINRQTKCKYCGKIFIKTNNRQEYCSLKCKTYAKQDQTAKSQRKRRKQIRDGYLLTNENEYVGTGYLADHPRPNENDEYKAIYKELIRLKLRPKIYS